MKSKVFMSYSHHDRPLASFLAQELSKHQVTIWSDEQIKPGEEWEEAISKALAEADVYMPLVSSTFLSSDFRIAELGAAYGLRKNILPVLLEGDIKYMPFKFVDFQILDARKMDKFELVSKIIENTTTMHESSK